MLRLAHLSIARPKSSLLAWLAFAGVLTAIATGLTGSFSPTKVVVPGTEASRAEQLSQRSFGPSVLVPVMLRGPQAQIDRQGPALVRALARRRDARVMSGFDTGAIGRGLRRRGAVMIVVAMAHTERQMVDTYQTQIDDLVHRDITAPVSAHISGQPTLDREIQHASVHDVRRAIYLALPILFLLLLLGLRSALAAAVLTLLAASTVGVAFGVMTLVGKVVDTDALAITFGALTGLTLSVSYALLITQRFREEELTTGSSRADAARSAATAVGTTGRAVLAGGGALIVSLLLAAAFSSNAVLTSVGIGAMICAVLGVVAAVVVMPAVLALLGQQLFSWTFPAFGPARRAWTALSVGGGGVVQRRAVFAGFFATVVLCAIGIPVLDMRTGPPGIANLPPSSTARTDFTTINRVFGAGWATPFDVLVVSNREPITSVAMLKRLDAFEARIARDPRVASVAGPGAFRAQTKDLAKLPKSLQDSAKMLKGGKKDLTRLQNGLGQAGAGAVSIQQGLRDAATGAGRLRSGSGQAGTGAGQLHSGLAQARTGATQIANGLGQALAGATALRDGAGQALTGSRKISAGLGTAAPTVSKGLPVVRQMAGDVQAGSDAVTAVDTSAQTATSELDRAQAALDAMTAGKDDPSYAAARAAIESARGSATDVTSRLGAVQSRMQSAAGIATAFAGQVAELSTGLQKLLTGSTQLTTGIGQLSAGAGALETGIRKLNSGGGDLSSGLTQLRDGAGALEAGLTQLTSGSGQLSVGLSGGVGPAGQLAAGLGTMHSGVAKFRGELPSPRDLEQLQAQSPGLFDSGYFVLAAVAGAPSAQRNQASFAVNLTRGGTAGQIVVIAKRSPSSPATQKLGDDLSVMAGHFARTAHVDAAVGGPAGQVGNYHTSIAARIGPVIAIIAVAVLVLMMLSLRSVLLPVVAVLFDLLTAAATFGVLSVLFTGGNPVLGGPGYIDPVTIIMVFAAIFGLSMVFEVYLLQRTRESFMAHGDAHRALSSGLRHTAAAATGVGLVSVALSIPFITSDLINVRQVGVGVLVAVALDAFLVRPVLLPAAVELLGRRGWWPTTSSTAPQPPSERTARPAGARSTPAHSAS